MEELRVAGLRALADLSGSYLEVDGKVVIRQARRFSDFANQPHSMIDVEEARVRVHGAKESDLWEAVAEVALNRARILLLVPLDDHDPGAEASLYRQRQAIRTKLFLGRLQLTGFVPVPVQDTVANFMDESDARFLVVNQARVFADRGSPWLEGLPGTLPVCLVNRGMITACIESRPEPPDLA